MFERAGERAAQRARDITHACHTLERVMPARLLRLFMLRHMRYYQMKYLFRMRDDITRGDGHVYALSGER